MNFCHYERSEVIQKHMLLALRLLPPRHYDFLSTNNFQKNQILGSIIEHSPHENSTNQAYNNFFENTFDWDLDFTFLHETVNTVIVT